MQATYIPQNETEAKETIKFLLTLPKEEREKHPKNFFCNPNLDIKIFEFSMNYMNELVKEEPKKTN